MKIHWKLINEYIEKASSPPKECRERGNECVLYVSCGPKNKCSRPCKYCLYWTGYGLEWEGDNK